MSMKKVDSAGFKDWVESLIGQGMVYGVQAKEGRFVFDRLRRAADLRLDYDVTILPPKKYLQPPREVLLEFDRDGNFESVFDEDPFLLLGVHPYDMVAIGMMDKVFTAGHRDAHYMARRDRATIVVSDVQWPSRNVFAGCMGTATGEDCTGHDLLMTQLRDGSTILESRTDKGDALLELLERGEDPTGADLEARRALWARNRDRMREHELRMNPADLPDLMERSYDHPVWQEKAALCYSCGSCNLVCPTCYCFDVQDDLEWDLHSGERSRSWDGCMLPGFAKVAGNHDFRPFAAARYRHRYFRKARYQYDQMGEIACVGCGRCITACTANIANPVEVYNRLLEEV